MEAWRITLRVHRRNDLICLTWIAIDMTIYTVISYAKIYDDEIMGDSLAHVK